MKRVTKVTAKQYLGTTYWHKLNAWASSFHDAKLVATQSESTIFIKMKKLSQNFQKFEKILDVKRAREIASALLVLPMYDTAIPQFSALGVQSCT